MIYRLSSLMTGKRRAVALAAIILLQALCATFFIVDAIVDFSIGSEEDGWHLGIEMLAAVVLTVGVVVLMTELRTVLQRMESMERGLRAARGEMTNIIQAFFDEWGLTPSERDVAQMILKGFDNENIARMRGTAPGTVRAQATRIYAKARVDGRAQLISVFMEELLCGDTEDDGIAHAYPPDKSAQDGKGTDGTVADEAAELTNRNS